MIVKYIGYDTVQKAEYFYLWLQNLSPSLISFYPSHTFSTKISFPPQNHTTFTRLSFDVGEKIHGIFEKKLLLFQEATKHGKKDKGNISFQAINLLVSFLIISDNTFDGEGRKSSKLCKITANLIHQVSIS